MSESITLPDGYYWDSSCINFKRKKLVDILYPVGSIYFSMNSTSPATLFGGTWTQITGKFVYCTTTSKTTGGSQTTSSISTTSSGKATGNTGPTTLTVDQIPSHSHYSVWQQESGGYKGNEYDSLPMVYAGTQASGGKCYSTKATGGGSSHTHTLNSHTHTISHTHGLPLPPYITAYAWYRTA